MGAGWRAPWPGSRVLSLGQPPSLSGAMRCEYRGAAHAGSGQLSPTPPLSA
jgi:hypothetical protein